MVTVVDHYIAHYTCVVSLLALNSKYKRHELGHANLRLGRVDLAVTETSNCLQEEHWFLEEVVAIVNV